MTGLDPALALTLRLSGALLFAAAAIHKLRHPARFRAALAGYGLLPPPLLGPAARTLPALEIAAAGALVAGPAPAAAGFAAALLALYSGSIAWALGARGRRGDCGCGGRPVPLRPALLARNALLAVLLGLLGLPGSERSLTAVDAVTVLGGALGLACLYAAAEEILALPRFDGRAAATRAPARGAA